MNKRSSAVLLAVCLSTPLFAATAAEPRAGRVIVINEQPATVSQQATARPSIMRMAVTPLAAGSVVAPLDGSYDHLFVAQTDEHGNIVIVCTDDHKAAEVTSSSVDTVLRLKTKFVKRMNAERE